MDGNQSPPGIRWKQINTPHFEIVFPAELQANANRVANTLEHVYRPVSASLSTAPDRISVFLPNQTMQANGGVTLAPRRSYWYSTPPQGGELGSVDWYDMLALHETRHVAQMSAVNVGFTRVLTRAFGDIGMTPPMLLIPNWWWEGDAVGVETALSSGGRGRMPEFDMQLRAHLLSGRELTYGQATRGSYAVWTPDHYLLGYFLTTHVKRTYGAAAWANIIRSTAERSYDPSAFSRALRRETGRGVEALYQETMNELRGLWETQLRELPLTDATQRTSRPTVWTSYTLPQFVDGESLVALRAGLRDRPELVRIDAAGTETPLVPISAMGGHISAAAGRVVWAESRPDARWGERDFTVIRLYELASRRVRTLTRPSKLFSPALSPDGRRIAAVEFTAARRAALVILDTETGAELLRRQAAPGEFLSLPKWSTSGDRIVFLRQHGDRTAVSALRLADTSVRDLVEATGENFGRMLLHGSYLLYNSPYSGIDNIYAIDLATSTRYQVSSRRFGSFNPSLSPDGRRLLFNDYTADGFAVAEMPFDPGEWTPLSAVQDRSIRYYEPLIAQEGVGNALVSVPDSVYEVTDYNGAADLLNVHSRPWSASPGGAWLGLSSTNKLNTLAVDVEYDYDRSERTNVFTVRGSYSGLYPILDFGIETGGRGELQEGQDGQEHRATWQERAIQGGLRVPLAFREGPFRKWLTLSAHASVVQVTSDAQSADIAPQSGGFASMTYEAQVGRSRSWIDGLQPDRGESVRLGYRHTLPGSDYQGALISAEGRVYRAGLGAQHRLMLTAGLDRQAHEGRSYPFASGTAFPRGYERSGGRSLLMLSGDYAVPLLHPDRSIGPLYVRRIAANLFYDYALSRGPVEATYRSTGLELTAETVPFSLPLSVELGVRSIYRFLDGQHRFQPIIGFRM